MPKKWLSRRDSFDKLYDLDGFILSPSYELEMSDFMLPLEWGRCDKYRYVILPLEEDIQYWEHEESQRELRSERGREAYRKYQQRIKNEV